MAAHTPEPAFNQAKAIAGKEELPATEVFKNTTQHKGVTTGRLLRIVELVYTSCGWITVRASTGPWR